MRTAIHVSTPSQSDEVPAPQPCRVLRFDANSESHQEGVSEAERRLQAEVRALQEALHEAQRQLTQYDVLLRNAQLRERELRAEMFKRK